MTVYIKKEKKNPPNPQKKLLEVVNLARSQIQGQHIKMNCVLVQQKTGNKLKNKQYDLQ